MTKKNTFITQFTRTPNSITNVGLIEFTKPSKVKESLSYATDINTIYDNYCKTGKLPLNGNQPIYDENFINYDNLIEAQQAVTEATKYFQTLPTDIRAQYGNSLAKFVSAIHSNDNFLYDKGVLVRPEPVVEPVAPQPIPTPSTDLKPVETPVTPVKPDIM